MIKVVLQMTEEADSAQVIMNPEQTWLPRAVKGRAKGGGGGEGRRAG